MLLDGVWEYSLNELPRDDSKWKQINVPNNWYLERIEHSGVVYSRKKFKAQPYLDKEYILKFYGVDYFCDVWLNDVYLGHHEGYFQPFEFLITPYLRKENILLVKVTSPREDKNNWPLKKKLIKGIFNDHDCRPGSRSLVYGQDHNTGGIWNSVEVIKIDGIRIKGIKIYPLLLPSGEAIISIDCQIENHREPQKAMIKYSLQGYNFSTESACYCKQVFLQRGDNKIETVIFIEKPHLWWTWDLSKPNLYEVGIEVEAKNRGIKLTQIFGIRKIEIDKDWNWYLNNKRIFPRGTNIIPTQWLAEYTQEKINKDVRLLKEANINAVRVHAHITRKEFYSKCDEEGILIWQDFTLQWGYEDSDEFIANASSQIEDMVNFLFNHPCIGVWCCHNEPCHTNREKLDFVLHQKVSSLDNTRYVDIASDFHFHPYPGWYYGHYKEFSGLPGKPFINEFGAQALPSLETLKEMFSSDELWPPLWERWAYHDFQYDQTFNIAKIDKGREIEEFIKNSQEYQAKLLKYAIEHYRVAKFKETTGLFQFMFVDCWPSITWSVVDYNRVPKKGYYALKQAYQPVLPVLKIGRERLMEGKRKLEGALYIINDTFRPYEEASIQITKKREGDLYFQFEKRIDIQSNCSQLICAFSPLDSDCESTKTLIPGEYTIKLTLKDEQKKILATNQYFVEVVPVEFKKL